MCLNSAPDCRYPTAEGRGSKPPPHSKGDKGERPGSASRDHDKGSPTKERGPPSLEAATHPLERPRGAEGGVRGAGRGGGGGGGRGGGGVGGGGGGGGGVGTGKKPTTKEERRALQVGW